MTSIPSPLRVPSKDLGRAADQSMLRGFHEGRQRDWWPFAGGKTPNGSFGALTGFGGFALFYRWQAKYTVDAYRNPDVMWDPARWGIIEFQPLPYPSVRPVKKFWPWDQWAANLDAARQTAFREWSRKVQIPWADDFRTPPVPDPRYADFGWLLDDDETGMSGLETLGLRIASQHNVDTINRAAGYDPKTGGSPMKPGDRVLDGIARRTASNIGKYEGRGCGNLPKRAGLLTPEDLLFGVDECKAIVFPNVAFGPKATAQPGFRVEHPLPKQIDPSDAFPMGDDPRMIRHGTRFTCTRSRNTGPNSIERWADSEGFTGDLRTSAINFAVGMCEFGGFSAETGRGQAGVEAVHLGSNPVQDEKYREAGVKTAADGWRLGNNLMAPGFVEVTNSPAMTAANFR